MTMLRFTCRSSVRRSEMVLALLTLLVPGLAGAQSTGYGSDEAGTLTVEPPSETTVTETVVPPPGYPAPGTDINSYLPSSSRPITGETQDSFDLNRASQSGSIVITGSAGSAAVGIGGEKSKGPVRVPEIHTVRRGDTLWDLSQHYYSNPWAWPQLWSMNPQVENPHWIYPGDQLRMRTAPTLEGIPEDNSIARGGFVARGALVPPETIFLRDQGYLGDPNRDVWGELVGSPEDQMLLSEGNTVYLLMKEGVDLNVGQQLTLFREVHEPPKVKGSRRPPGEIVKVYGTVRVNRWDPETRIARGLLTESVDVIERGTKVGPVGRRFDVVPPKPAEVDLVARVLTSLYPNVYYGRNQVVFLDRGSEDGLEAGNRLKVLRRGDVWRRNLKTASKMARARIRMESPKRVPVEDTPLKGDDTKFPEEVIGELQILRTERYSSVALVSQSSQELIAGDRAVSVAGY